MKHQRRSRWDKHRLTTGLLKSHQLASWSAYLSTEEGMNSLNPCLFWALTEVCQSVKVALPFWISHHHYFNWPLQVFSYHFPLCIYRFILFSCHPLGICFNNLLYGTMLCSLNPAAWLCVLGFHINLLHVVSRTSLDILKFLMLWWTSWASRC